MACILVCYLGIGQHVEMIMIGNIMPPDPGSPDDELIPGFHQRGHDQRTSAFSEAMITAICVAAGFILSKILLGGML